MKYDSVLTSRTAGILLAARACSMILRNEVNCENSTVEKKGSLIRASENKRRDSVRSDKNRLKLIQIRTGKQRHGRVQCFTRTRLTPIQLEPTKQTNYYIMMEKRTSLVTRLTGFDFAKLLKNCLNLEIQKFFQPVNK